MLVDWPVCPHLRHHYAGVNRGAQSGRAAPITSDRIKSSQPVFPALQRRKKEKIVPKFIIEREITGLGELPRSALQAAAQKSRGVLG